MEDEIKLQDPPHDLETEQQVLGAIFLNDKLIEDLHDRVKISAFYEEYHRKIYTAMLYLFNSKSTISYKKIIDRLRSKDELEDVEYILKLNENVPSTANFTKQVDYLLDLFQKREVFNVSKKIVTSDISGYVAPNIIGMIESTIENMNITNNIEYSEFSDYIDDWVVDLESPIEPVKYKFGFKGLDEMVMLESSDLMLIAARPSVGKSALATNLVENFCKQGLKPFFVSLEMNKKQFMNRLVANMSNVTSDSLKKKEIKSDEWAKILTAKEEIKDFKFKFYDEGTMYVEQLHGLAKYFKKRDELDIIVIDYLQLLSTHKYKGQKVNEVGEISRRLKMIAMELDVPVIALSQLNRGNLGQDRVPREPQLSDLRNSGDLEQDASIVAMLHTEDIDQKFGKGTYGRYIDLFVRKNRNGKLGKMKFEYFGDYIRFVEKEWDSIQGKYVEVQQNDIKQGDNDSGVTKDDLPF